MSKYTKLKNGRYMTRIYMGIDESGNKQFEYLYASSKKAQTA